MYLDNNPVRPQKITVIENPLVKFTVRFVDHKKTTLKESILRIVRPFKFSNLFTINDFFDRFGKIKKAIATGSMGKNLRLVWYWLRNLLHIRHLIDPPFFVIEKLPRKRNVFLGTRQWPAEGVRLGKSFLVTSREDLLSGSSSGKNYNGSSSYTYTPNVVTFQV